MRAAGLPDCELSLTLVTDESIRRLNRRFRNRNEPTDVLSFSQIEEQGGPAPDPARVPNRPGMPLGDVVLSVETALRQARDLGVTPQARLRTLLVHGFLHLLGYDHERSAPEAKKMFARERALNAAVEGGEDGVSLAARSRASERDRRRVR